MRRFPDIFLCLLLGLSFLAGKAGLTVHHCLREGSSHVVLLSADPSCRAVHAQQAGHTPEADCTRDNSASHGSCERIHDQDCCSTCLLYTSDAADDLLCVALGGRRLIKKKTRPSTTTPPHIYYLA